MAFDRRAWLGACDAERTLEGGRLRSTQTIALPNGAGPRRQPAFRDAFADFVLGARGWLPTLRIADFELQGWIHERGARTRLFELLGARVVPW